MADVERATPTHSVKAYVRSDRVEGTAVYRADGTHIGAIRRLIIEKESGRAIYAVISFESFLGVDDSGHTIPWSRLEYDRGLDGYRTNISEGELKEAPAFSRQDDHDWSDRDREEELHEYYRIPAYWRAI
jgi:PRC-barrel domain